MIRHGNNTKHGKTNTRAYRIWVHIKDRCFNPNDKGYKNYGGRGITVCEEWVDKKNGFINFYNDVSKLPHFDEEGYSLNRIDNDGNYELSNVEWANDITQANNKRNNHKVSYNGEEKTIAQWANEYNLDYVTLRMRIIRGWSIKRALTEKPIIGKNRYSKKTS